MAADPLPAGQEPNETRRLDRLDLLAQRRQRPAPQLAHDVRVAPLPLDAVGTELALDHLALADQLGEHGPGHLGGDAEAMGELGGRERTVGPGEPLGQAGQRRLDGFGEHGRQADGDGDTQRVPEPSGILGRRPSPLSGHADLDGPPVLGQLTEPSLELVLGAIGHPGRQLELGHRAEHPQQVMELIGVAGGPLRGEPLQFELDLGDDLGVEQRPELLGTEQIPQELTVQAERSGPTLGQRRVALVHVDGDPPEQERSGERRGLRRLDRDHPDPPAAHLGHHPPQGGKVEDVVAALPGGLQQHREARDSLAATASRSAAR